MKSLLFALVAAVAVATGTPAAQAAAPAEPAGATTGQAVSAHVTGSPHRHYTKKARPAGYWYRGRWYSTYRAPRAARTRPVSWAARAAGTKKWQLPEYAPKYSASGKYIPTQYIYQQTNGEFRILTPTAAPVTKGTPGGATELRRALQGINGAQNRPAAAAGAAGAPPAPPAPPAAPAAPAGRAAPGSP